MNDAPAEKLRVRLDLEVSVEGRRDTDRPGTLYIENNSERSLRVHVNYLLPESAVRLEAATDSYLHRGKIYGALCSELRLLIQDEYFFGNRDLVEARRDQIVELINDAIMMSGGSGITHKVMQIWRLLLSPILAQAAYMRWQERFNANQLVIDNYRDAEMAWKTVANLPRSTEDESARNRELIALKLFKLRELEDERLAVKESGGWTIEPSSVHSESFILTCRKNLFSVRRYPVVIEVTAETTDASVELERGVALITKRASASVEVPPRDVMLAFLAALSAPIGFLTRLTVHDPGTLLSAISVPQAIVTMVLGFIASIGFERIKWGNTGFLSLNWRTSVILGFGAGFATENLLKAFQAFFGLT